MQKFMKYKDAEYKNQMISVDVCAFSIINNKLNVLLLKRAEEPYKNMWSLIGGLVYNNETCENAVKRELEEKLDIHDISPILSSVFSEPKRDIRFRNISISYFCLVNPSIAHKINTKKVLEVKWFDVSDSMKLAFDHNDILSKAISQLKEKVFDINFIKPYLPEQYTLPTLQTIYESILQTKLDKRNFRRKLNSLNCLIDTGDKNESDKHKKSIIYRFK